MLIVRTKYNPLLYPVGKSQATAIAKSQANIVPKLSFHLPFNVMNAINAKAAAYVPGELVPEIIKSVSLTDFEQIDDCVFIHPAMKEKYGKLLKLLEDRVTDCSRGNRNIPIIAQEFKYNPETNTFDMRDHATMKVEEDDPTYQYASTKYSDKTFTDEFVCKRTKEMSKLNLLNGSEDAIVFIGDVVNSPLKIHEGSIVDIDEESFAVIASDRRRCLLNVKSKNAYVYIRKSVIAAELCIEFEKDLSNDNEDSNELKHVVITNSIFKKKINMSKHQCGFTIFKEIYIDGLYANNVMFLNNDNDDDDDVDNFAIKLLKLAGKFIQSYPNGLKNDNWNEIGHINDGMLYYDEPNEIIPFPLIRRLQKYLKVYACGIGNIQNVITNIPMRKISKWNFGRTLLVIDVNSCYSYAHDLALPCRCVLKHRWFVLHSRTDSTVIVYGVDDMFWDSINNAYVLIGNDDMVLYPIGEELHLRSMQIPLDNITDTIMKEIEETFSDDDMNWVHDESHVEMHAISHKQLSKLRRSDTDHFRNEFGPYSYSHVHNRLANATMKRCHKTIIKYILNEYKEHKLPYEVLMHKGSGYVTSIDFSRRPRFIQCVPKCKLSSIVLGRNARTFYVPHSSNIRIGDNMTYSPVPTDMEIANLAMLYLGL